MIAPEHEFAVRAVYQLQLGGATIPVTNTAIALVAGEAAALAALVWMARGSGIVPDRRGAALEMLIAFVAGIVQANVRPEGMRFFPAIFALFVFILAGNLAGLIPAGFAPNAQIAVTGAMAALVFVFVVALRIRLHGWRFVLAFAPRGVPWWLLPLVLPIEAISFLARPVTLAVRLFANMTAGHMALAVLGALGLAAPWWLAPLPLALSVVQLAMEVAIALLQAYIFTVLVCVYLEDALAERH